MALERTWCADPEPGAHHQTQIERGRMDEQPLQHVLVPADMRTSERAGFVQMCARSLEQLATSTQEPLATQAADATALG